MQNLAKPEVRFGDWISEGWKMFTEQWKAWVINSLIFLGITAFPLMVVIIGFYIYIFSTISSASRTRGAPPDELFGAIVGFYIAIFALSLVSMVASCFFMGGMHLSAIKQLQGGKVEVRDLFSGARYFFPVLGATLLSAILIGIGAMLCVVPGFLAMGCLFFTMPLLLHKRLGVIEAMQTSYELTKQNIWMFALFAFVTQLIAQVGTYAFYVGILATFPLLFTITAVAYRDTFGVEGARYFRPTTPPTPTAYAQPYGDYYAPNQPPNFPANYPVNPPMNYPPTVVDTPFISATENQSSRSAAPADNSPLPTAPQLSQTDQIIPPVTDEITPAPTGLVCPQCQIALPPSATFCPQCGTRIG